MANLTNGLEYPNTHFQEAFGEYLISNNFKAKVSCGMLAFSNGKIKVCVADDCMDVFEFAPELESQDHQKWQYKRSHIGLGGMDIFNFIMLMHIMKVQSIAGFVSNAKKEGKQIATEADFIVKSIINTQLQTA